MDETNTVPPDPEDQSDGLGSGGAQQPGCIEERRTLQDFSTAADGFQLTVQDFTDALSSRVWLGDCDGTPARLTFVPTPTQGEVVFSRVEESTGGLPGGGAPQCVSRYEFALEAMLSAAGRLQEAFFVRVEASNTQARWAGEIALEDIVGTERPSFSPEMFGAVVLSPAATLVYGQDRMQGVIMWYGEPSPVEPEPGPNGGASDAGAGSSTVSSTTTSVGITRPMCSLDLVPE